MERLIVFALVFLLPTQLAYHFWPQSSYIQGLRVDYLSPAIYLTDILIVLLLPYLIKRIQPIKARKTLFLFLPAVILALLNIVFAQAPMIAFFKWVTVFKLAIIGLYFYTCDLDLLQKTIDPALSSSLVAFFLIGLLQFLLQRTVGGPFYFLGERSFTSATPGISLMNLFGKSMMKAYSTFSHPNSFAGFVVVSFLIFLSFNSKRLKVLTKRPFILFVVALSLILTFSLNATVGACLVIMLFFLLKYFPKIIKKTKLFLPIVVIGLSMLFGGVSLMLPKEVPLKESYKERIVFAGQAIDTFSKRPILGVGLNNFFFAAKRTQPPHNIYLLVLSETGIIGILVLYFLLSGLFRQKLNKYLFLAVFFVLVTGLFDHYWFTLSQNQLLLAVLLGLSARKVYY